MHLRSGRLIFAAAILISLADAHFAVDAAPPRVTSDRYKLELVAREPDIVTPTGMAFDREGRLLIIESNTHQRPKEYDGPLSDRILMLAAATGKEKLDRWSQFADGFRHAMNLLVRPDGGVYVVTRGSVVLLRDTNGDGVADQQKELIRLETEDDYPHNALGGIAQAADGSLILGLGENHGLPFRLIGSDGKEIAATGGLDGFFRCTADGANLEHIARGVWNPFSLCVLNDGRIFAVDNDPDASPPCRLLHVVPGGDYGYLYQYGRAGTHPLQCWNGELPGTLPMVCGVGEAPTAIVAHGGWLWVTSWGDHRIERYRPVPRGASYGAEREVVVQGDVDFRPTGMAVAPDGSLYFGDWVLRDYPVHGKGRLWRLTLPSDEVSAVFPARSTEDAATLNSPDPIAAAESSDPYTHAQAVWQLSKNDDQDGVPASNPRLRLSTLEAYRLQGLSNPELLLERSLNDESAEVRLFALRWIADDRLVSLRDDVAALLDGPQPSSQYYQAVLAAVDWLDNEPKMRGRDFTDELLVRELQNSKRLPAAHALALASLSPNNKFLTLGRLRDYLQADYRPLRLEAVRTLAQQRDAERLELLAIAARDSEQSDEVRAEAIVGLAPAADSHKVLLEQLLGGDNRTLRKETERVLRLTKLRPVPEEAKPSVSELSAWHALLKEPGDAAAGRRLFFSSVGARCAVCHEYSGRGGRIGPDLTHVGRSTSRERIIDSILAPSQEVAPHYQPWMLVTKDGKTLVGLRLAEGGDDGTEEYTDSAGDRLTLKSDEIESREAATKSIMPDGLESTISIADLRDLVTFLTSDSNPQ
jgi:putative membrane-bound dehydrogenase-like protein